MSASFEKLVCWTARALSIAFALFLSLFALDVFGEGYQGVQFFLALMIHQVPTGIVVLVIVLAWRWEWIGAALFVVAGLMHMWGAWQHPSWIVTISGPLFVVVGLFFVSWINHRHSHAER